MIEITHYWLCDYCRFAADQGSPSVRCDKRGTAKRKVVRDGQSPQYVCRHYEARVSDI